MQVYCMVPTTCVSNIGSVVVRIQYNDLIYKSNLQYNDLISRAQIVCGCVGVRVWRPRLLSVRNRNRQAHSARIGEGLRKKYAQGPLSKSRPKNKISR